MLSFVGAHGFCDLLDAHELLAKLLGLLRGVERHEKRTTEHAVVGRELNGAQVAVREQEKHIGKSTQRTWRINAFQIERGVVELCVLVAAFPTSRDDVVAVMRFVAQCFGAIAAVDFECLGRCDKTNDFVACERATHGAKRAVSQQFGRELQHLLLVEVGQ